MRKRNVVGNGKGKAKKKKVKRTQIAVARMSNMNPVRSSTRGGRARNPQTTFYGKTKMVKKGEGFEARSQVKAGRTTATRADLSKAKRLYETDKKRVSVLKRKVKLKSLTKGQKSKAQTALKVAKSNLSEATKRFKRYTKEYASFKKEKKKAKKAGYSMRKQLTSKGTEKRLDGQIKESKRNLKRAEKVGGKKKRKSTKRKAKKKTARRKTKKKATRKRGKKKTTRRKKKTTRKKAKKKTTRRKAKKTGRRKKAKRKTRKSSGRFLKRGAYKGKMKASKAKKRVGKIFTGKTKLKKKQAAKFKVKDKGKKKTRNYKVTKTNPYHKGGSMKHNPSQVENYLKHSYAEMVGLTAGGAGHNILNKVAIKYAPGFVATVMGLPVVGKFATSLIPMGGGALMGMFTEKIQDPTMREWAEHIAKGVIGASLAGIGSALSQGITAPLGLEGVDLTPLGGVDLTPLGQEESPADFGGVDLTPMDGEESAADFGQWDEQIVAHEYGGGTDMSEDSFGFEESPADFGTLDMSEDFY